MHRTLAVGVATLSVFLLMIGPLAQVGEMPSALGHHREGHGGGPPNGGGNGDGDGGSATIELIQCDSGGAAKWNNSIVTYAIDNRATVKQGLINAVDTGIQEWNTVGAPYTLVRDDAAASPDVTVIVFNKIIPGFILGASFVTCPDTATGIVPHEIWLGVKGLKTNGAKNLAAHEMGHSIGLGHTTDKNEDLMGPSLDAEERKKLTCPSNLDVEALSATGTSYTVSDWALLEC